MNKFFAAAVMIGILGAGTAYANPGAGPAGPAAPGPASASTSGGGVSGGGTAASSSGYSTSAAATAATAIDAASSQYPLAVNRAVGEAKTR